MLFYTLLGLTIVRYDDFMYYYKLNVLGFTQFQYTMLMMGGTIAMMIMVIVYQRFMTKWETQTLVRFCLTIFAVNALASLILTKRWNIAMGISDTVFVALTGSTFFPICVVMYILPPFVLIAKITPAHVEATIFAFSASLINMGIHFGWKYMGLAWNNLLFDIDNDNL